MVAPCARSVPEGELVGHVGMAASVEDRHCGRRTALRGDKGYDETPETQP